MAANARRSSQYSIVSPCLGYVPPDKAHVAQSEEDEPALFMVSACVPNLDSKSTEVEVINDDIEPEKELQLGVAKAALAGEPIQLEKERVFAQIIGK